jgi:pimeloyl-ACP methyl ester carboxylesterase
MKQIWYIHGANETPTCFNYIKSELPEHKAIDLEYNCHAPIVSTVAQIIKTLPKHTELNFVTHSLGGLIAVALSYYHPVQKIVSLASPFGGSESANYLRFMFPTYGLFKNVATVNPLIQEISKRGVSVPTLNVVATTGYNPLSAARNDGVITIESQRKLKGATHVEVLHNHFEILLADEVVSLIENFVW